MSAELVEQLAYFIKLTPLETHHLREAWKMTRMGEDAYYIRKSIDHFLCDFPNKSTPPSYDFTPSHLNLTKQLSFTQNCLLLNSRQAIDSSVHQIYYLRQLNQMDRLLFSFSLTIRFCCICCLRSSLPVHYRSIIFSV